MSEECHKRYPSLECPHCLRADLDAAVTDAARGVLRDAIVDAWVRDEPPYRTATGKFGPSAGVFPELSQ